MSSGHSGRMGAARRTRPAVLLWVVGLALAITLVAAAPATIFAQEELPKQYYVIEDESGKTILETGIVVHVGDIFIDSENDKYEVFEVIGLRARARVTGLEPVEAAGNGAEGAPPEAVAAQAGGSKPLVAIYHTHSDESYIPTDGTSSIDGHGGIYAVGASLAMAAKKAGLDATQDTALHNPHDAAAYDRSRRTALQLLKDRPTILLDVHRDSAPLTAYETTVASTLVTKVMIVVGRANPTENANLGVAKSLKAALDQKFPGLVKGIFMAMGKYNQDLYPRAILLEFGGENNPRSEAEAAARFVGETLPGFLTGQLASGSVGGASAQGGGFLTALAWILGLVLVGGAAFLFINAGNWPEARRKLRQMWSTEMASFFGRFRWARRANPVRGSAFGSAGPPGGTAGRRRLFRRRKRNRPPTQEP